MSNSDDVVEVRLLDPHYPAAERLVLDAKVPSISLLIRSFAIGYSRATGLIRAMEGHVIGAGELDRYTAFLQQSSETPFDLRLCSVDRRAIDPT